MRWQDWVFSVGTAVFALALLPSIFSSSKPALSSSLMTGVVLSIFVIAYASLALWSSAIITAIAAALWFVLAMQKFRASYQMK